MLTALPTFKGWLFIKRRAGRLLLAYREWPQASAQVFEVSDRHPPGTGSYTITLSGLTGSQSEESPT